MGTKLNVHRESKSSEVLGFGGLGIRVLTSSSAAGEHFGCLHATEASQIDATCNLDEGDASITNLSLPAGMAIYGDFSSITVDSGTVIGYLIEV